MWEPRLSGVELHSMEICEGVVEKESLEVCGPQSVENFEILAELGEPSVEAAKSVPTEVVEVKEDFSVEVLASVEKKERDQAEGTVAELALETAERSV